MEVPLVALTEDVFQRSGVRVPVYINRTVTVVGSPQLPEWPMLQFMAWHTVGASVRSIHSRVSYHAP